METIGLIAGRGNFPLLFAQEARKKGFSVTAIAVRGNTKGAIGRYADKLYWIKVTEFNRIISIFKGENISKAAMAGQINPYLLFNPRVMRNPAVRDFFGQLEDRRADTVFRAFTCRLQEAGLTLLDSTSYLSNHLPKEGLSSKRGPSSEEYSDIRLGLKIARHLGALDIGQSVCVKNGVILAVESVEGTDNTIRRAYSLSKSEIVLVKTSKPSQDMRFDVPVVGLGTIKRLPAGSCLSIEAGKTLFLDKEEAIRLADRKSIAIVASA